MCTAGHLHIKHNCLLSDRTDSQSGQVVESSEGVGTHFLNSIVLKVSTQKQNTHKTICESFWIICKQWQRSDNSLNLLTRVEVKQTHTQWDGLLVHISGRSVQTGKKPGCVRRRQAVPGGASDLPPPPSTALCEADKQRQSEMNESVMQNGKYLLCSVSVPSWASYISALQGLELVCFISPLKRRLRGIRRTFCFSGWIM